MAIQGGVVLRVVGIGGMVLLLRFHAVLLGNEVSILVGLGKELNWTMIVPTISGSYEN